MRILRVVAWRALLGLLSAWTVLTAVFALFTLTEDWVLEQRLGALKWRGAEEQTVDRVAEQYLAARGFDRPLWAQYVDWLGDMLTLEWGTSFRVGEPVFPLVVGSVARTAAYVLPALVVAVAAGVSLGLYVALNPESRLADYGLGTAYALFAVPNFWIGGLLVSLAAGGVVARPPLLFGYVLPALLTATTILGGVVSYARAYSVEYASAEFVRLVTAKGASKRRVGAHVLRNAAIPVLSMVFTEVLALLVLAVFVVEVLFGIEGFGLLLFRSVQERDLPVLLGGTLVIIAVGVLGNVAQDLSYGVLDPRVGTDKR
ncbi:ABC transporter permease [Haloarcula nitratireducens]|uniref:ABC transporter permease n=1 Tax=Haloarcula nitratireducens TaxID=2487749 RepID=A0AAW4PC54_9EURY|nr:ABC transporter permease [Halomicroarcula nitratireducens]MBX0295484.1 ABC transporter permease [Halomicroarcula nitratireducens]